MFVLKNYLKYFYPNDEIKTETSNGETMFVVVKLDRNDFGVTTKDKWNKNNFYLPSDHASHQEALEFLESISPNFCSRSESVFAYINTTNKNCKKGIEILLAAGVQLVQLGKKA